MLDEPKAEAETEPVTGAETDSADRAGPAAPAPRPAGDNESAGGNSPAGDGKRARDGKAGKAA
jgi:hypothetical protein